MNQHPIFDHFCRLSCGLLMLAFSASFSGCGSAPASLAVEGTGAAALPDVTAGTMPTPAAEAVSQPVPETASSALQPKLTTVDRNQLVGCWRDSFFGTRTLTLNSDGTAAMVLELDFAGRLLYGSRLDFDMVWSVEGAVVTIDILEGTPSKSAKSLMNTWGNRYVYLLDCVADHQVEMRDDDGSMSYVLRRIPNESESNPK